jgi:hypothetical protein
MTTNCSHGIALENGSPSANCEDCRRASDVLEAARDLLEGCDDLDDVADALHSDGGFTDSEIETTIGELERLRIECVREMQARREPADAIPAELLRRKLATDFEVYGRQGETSHLYEWIDRVPLLDGKPPAFEPFDDSDYMAFGYPNPDSRPHRATLPTGNGTDSETYTVLAVYDDSQTGTHFELHLEAQRSDSAEALGYADGPNALRALLALRNGMPEADFLALFEAY